MSWKIKSPSPVSVPVQNPISRYEKDARTLVKPDNHIILICSQLSVEQSFPEGIIKPYEGTSLMIGWKSARSTYPCISVLLLLQSSWQENNILIL